MTFPPSLNLKKNLRHYIWIQWKICLIFVKNVPIDWKGWAGKTQVNTATSDFCATWAHCEILYIIHWALSHGHIRGLLQAYKSLRKLEPPKCRVNMRRTLKARVAGQMCEILAAFCSPKVRQKKWRTKLLPNFRSSSPFLLVFQLKYWEDIVETLLDQAEI